MSKDPGLEKMTFVGYSDRDLQNEIGEVRVQINPSTFTRSLSVDVPESDNLNGKGTTGKDSSLKSEKYSFDIVFDGTGAVDDFTGSMSIDDDPLGINVEIEDLLDIIYARRGDDGKRYPTFVKMYYCGMEFRCMLTSLSITYTLFHRNGAPLRGRLSCSFTSMVTPGYDNRDRGDSAAGKNARAEHKYQDCEGNTFLMVQEASNNEWDTLY